LCARGREGRGMREGRGREGREGKGCMTHDGSSPAVSATIEMASSASFDSTDRCVCANSAPPTKCRSVGSSSIPRMSSMMFSCSGSTPDRRPLCAVPPPRPNQLIRTLENRLRRTLQTLSLSPSLPPSLSPFLLPSLSRSERWHATNPPSESRRLVRALEPAEVVNAKLFDKKQGKGSKKVAG
jgi:hypothetical protein